MIPSPGNPKSRAMTIPAFYREQRPPLVRTLAGPEAEAEVAGKWGEAAGAEAAEREAAAHEGAAGGPAPAAQTTTLKQNASFVWKRRDLTPHTGLLIALGLPALLRVT